MSDEVSGAFVFRFGNCELDASSGELRVGGAETEIEPRPRALLICLLRQSGKMLTKEQLIDEVWGGRVVGETVVGNAVLRARKAIGDVDGKIIRNERNKGYVLVADVEVLPAQRRPVFELTAGNAIPGRGSWQLIERLGQGGAGEVWLCEDGERNRRVFKFSLGSDHDAALKREVTLSRLLSAALEEDKRQNYVQILEWNIEVHPYHIEFEYAGINLRTWAAQKGGLHTVPLSDRIDLMARIAAAVGDAHSVSVLHKDLKPDNVLVEERDGRVLVRLTDFGAGHLLARERAEQLDITVRGWTVTHADTKSGTMLWMAPELFEGGGATLQSDLYSLGVMLYQVVMGDFGRVLAPDWYPDIADEILRDDIDAVTKRNPEQRLADAHELARKLRTLEFRREERRRSNAAEIRAANAEEIVRRARVRRPYLILAAVALVGGLITSTYFYYRQVQQTREARALAEFMTEDLLQTALPNAGGSPSISLQDAMLKSVGLAQKRFAGQPALEDQVLKVYGNTFSELGHYSALEQVERRQAVLDASLHGPTDVETLNDHLMLAYALLVQGKITPAQTELDEVRHHAAALRDDPSFFPFWMQIEVQFAQQQADFMGMYRLTQRLIQFYEKSPKADPATVNLTHLWAAQALVYAGQPAEAEKIVRERLPFFEKQGSDDAPYRWPAYELLYTALRDEGQLADADRGFATVCDALDRQYGADNKDAAACREQQAQLDEDLGRWTIAAERLSKVAQVYRALDGCAGTSRCIYMMADYAFALDRAGRGVEAMPMAAQTLADADHSSTPDLSALPQALYVYARVAIDQGHLKEAREAIDRYRNAIASNPATVDTEWQGRYELLEALLAARQADTAQARQRAAKAIELFKAARTKVIVENNDAKALLQ